MSYFHGKIIRLVPVGMWHVIQTLIISGDMDLPVTKIEFPRG